MPKHTRALAVLIVVYASFYLCRANVDAAQVPFCNIYGYTKAQWGAAMAWVVLGHAVGKTAMGALGDRIGGKALLSLCAIGSIGLSLGMSLVSSLTALVILATFNRLFQAGGWSGVVNVASYSFPNEKRGSLMGLLSISYVAGSPIALIVCGLIVDRASWRALFLLNPALLFGAIVLGWIMLPSSNAKSPEHAPTIEHAPESHAPESKERYGVVLRSLFRKPAFWLALVLSAMLTFVQTCFVSWMPRYLYDVASAVGESGAISGSLFKSALFGGGGILGALLAGRISDRFGPGKRAPVMAVFLGLHVVAVFALAHVPVKSSLHAAAIVGVCGLFLQGPYTLLLGAVALDLGGKSIASTTVGLIDGVGYLAGAAAPLVIGAIAEKSGWSRAFDLIGIAGTVATVVTILWAVRAKKD